MQNNTKLSIMEFKEYCEHVLSKEYIFDTYNQKTPSDNSLIHMSFRFDNMMIRYNPNSICFTLGRKNALGKYMNYLKISKVKYIIFREKIMDSSVFTIVCGNYTNDSCDKTYEFLLA